jgi:dienelactone hydrolase
MSFFKSLYFCFSFLFFLNYGFCQSTKFKEIKGKTDYPFILFLPDSSSIVGKPPVIVFLHGRSLSGDDLGLVRKYGVIDAIEKGRKIPAIVVAPQVKRSSFWQPEKVLNVLEYIQKNYETDLTRVYIVGMSLGGYGTLNFIGKYPDRVAAAVALCGGGDIHDACNIGKTNVWIQHGENDKAVPVSESIKIYNAVYGCNPRGDCKLTLYPSYGHGELAHEFYKDTLYNWIFQYRLNDTLKKSVTLIQDTLKNNKIEEIKTTLSKDAKKGLNELITNSNPCYHIIKKGDTLYSLSKKYKISIKKLCKNNGIEENTKLKVGQKIKINCND